MASLWMLSAFIATLCGLTACFGCGWTVARRQMGDKQSYSTVLWLLFWSGLNVVVAIVNAARY